jgi:hypothetical protein
MIINPAIGGDLKARRARASRGGAISWAGMDSSNGGGGNEGDGGGQEGGGSAEITVEKLG